MTDNATFANFESSGGARISRLPLEVFPNFCAYVYVVQKEDSCILIDAGSGMDSSHENLVSGLQHVGIRPSDLTHILLTHAHIDHFGGLGKLRPMTNAKIGTHELDVQTVAHHEARVALIGRRLRSFLTDAGLTDERRDQILRVYRLSKAIYHSIPVDFTYESIEMRLGAFEFIHLPGHCPGHVAIRLDDILFCGDMVVQGVTPHLSPESINPYSGLDHYLGSLARLGACSQGARLIFNGHDEVIRDLPAQIEATKENIWRRMSKAVEALRLPLTIEEVCRAVYGEMGGYNQLLVIEKMGAYVEYLYEHGLIEITNPDELEQGGPARFQRLREESVIWEEVERKLGMDTGTQVYP